ncbi:hypothetical protein [Roseimicrobium sp. ORNL1]|uniref:hypothetical protein n=1 Tax=Roseimicrobium sp. ORNL1 TaxID=2711231 RepID=UPI0013E11C91|nr:hypothetical protein [Roseimicrobium sp. ORNL1]QIF03290.1 hypothetical protein G5S37_17755 [Roseimicrobium sp. ORNL1]
MDHPAMSSVFDEKARADMAQKFERLRGSKPTKVTSRVVSPMAPVEFRFAFVQYDEMAYAIVVTGTRRGGEWLPFAISVSSVNEVAALTGELPQFYRFLPKYEMNASLIATTGAALKEAVAAQDYGIFDRYIRRLAADAGPLPSFFDLDLTSRENFNNRANAMLKQLGFRPEVSFLGARSLTDDFFIAAFSCETKFGPGVMLAFFLLHEGKPSIVAGQIELGTKALTFLPDMQKPEKVTDAGR